MIVVTHLVMVRWVLWQAARNDIEQFDAPRMPFPVENNSHSIYRRRLATSSRCGVVSRHNQLLLTLKYTCQGTGQSLQSSCSFFHRHSWEIAVDAQPPFSRPTSSSSPADRLDNWKSVAEYLRRDVRTAQRWEATEGLPVYRHRHSRHGSVYAYKSEIDAWWKNRHPTSRKHRSETRLLGQRSRMRFKPSHTQLAIYAFLLVVFAFSLVKAKQMFLADPASPRTAVAVSPSHPLAIAVLPFRDLSNGADDGTLAQALTEKIANALRKSKSLCVIDHTLIAHFQDGDNRPEHIAQLLHSDKMVRGTAGRSGGNIQITAELIDPRTGKTLWTRRFANDAVKWLQTEDEVAKEIATGVEAAALGPSSATQPAQPPSSVNQHSP